MTENKYAIKKCSERTVEEVLKHYKEVNLKRAKEKAYKKFFHTAYQLKKIEYQEAINKARLLWAENVLNQKFEDYFDEKAIMKAINARDYTDDLGAHVRYEKLEDDWWYGTEGKPK